MEVSAQQVGVDEARPYIREPNVQVSHVSLLFERLQIDVLHGLRGRVAWRGAEALGTSDGAYGGDVASAVHCEVAVRLANHAGEPQGICLNGVQFDVLIQLPVLLPDARCIEEQVHAAQRLDESVQQHGRVVLRHIDALRRRGLEFTQLLLAPCRHAHFPTVGHQALGHFSADARRGTDDYSMLLHVFSVYFTYYELQSYEKSQNLQTEKQHFSFSLQPFFVPLQQKLITSNMEKILSYVQELVAGFGFTGSNIDLFSHIVLVTLAFLLAWFVYWFCRRILVPILLKVTAKTEYKWDDILFSERVLTAICRIVPAIVIWQLLPWTFFQFPTVRTVLTRLTAIYITVMSVLAINAFINSMKLIESDKSSSRQQYMYSLCSILKIIIMFIAAIVVISIIVNKNPATLFAGLGAISAILMLVFQDTIKGLVAGIRLTTNDMVHVGDWITVPSTEANGRVEEITLTTVKIRNFDNTIVTVTPQLLVDGSFQNWLGMEQQQGRRQLRQVAFDFRSITLDEEGVANITKFRKHIVQWLTDNPKVVAEKTPLVRQAEGTQSGCVIEFVFWLHAQEWAEFERDSSDIMEYIYAASNDYGLRIFQQFPQQ